MAEPVESLRRAACGLLQTELPDEQKRMAEAMLENALLLQTTLQEAPANAGGAESVPTTTADRAQAPAADAASS
jgi:hypothetical protein